LATFVDEGLDGFVVILGVSELVVFTAFVDEGLAVVDEGLAVFDEGLAVFVVIFGVDVLERVIFLETIRDFVPDVFFLVFGLGIYIIKG
tara:strand:+ start:227 stop:493 length:267 start_codon:yes stop_codon:yes gene_type:complete